MERAQITVRAPRELLTKFQKTIRKGGEKKWGAQKQALEEAMKLWLHYRGGVPVALADNGVATFDEIKSLIRSGEEFSIHPLEEQWGSEEKVELKDIVLELLENDPPEKIFVGDSRGTSEDVRENKDAPVFCVWGDKPDPVLEKSFGNYLRNPDKQLFFSKTEFSLEIKG